MKKLLFFLPDITTIGGVEKVVSNLATYLSNSPKYEVAILTCISFKKPFFYQISSNVSIYTLDQPIYPKGILAKIRWYQNLIKLLDEFLINIPVDIVFAEGSYLALCLALTKNKKVIKVGCEHISHDAVHVLQKLFRKIWYKKLSALVVLVKHDQAYFSSFLSQVYHIPNFILPVKQGSPRSECQTIVSSGRLTHQKGFDLLIKAFVQVHSKFPNWNLIIYGDGEQRKKLENLIHHCSLSSCVSLGGINLHLIEEMGKAKIFILPSRYEGFPMVLLEAMSLGLPCICSDINGSNEIIKHGVNGMLVSTGNVSALADEIINLIKTEEQRDKIGAEALKTANKYQIDSVIVMWEKLIDHLINQNKPNEI